VAEPDGVVADVVDGLDDRRPGEPARDDYGSTRPLGLDAVGAASR
jgi:hypothetical protein